MGDRRAAAWQVTRLLRQGISRAATIDPIRAIAAACRERLRAGLGTGSLTERPDK